MFGKKHDQELARTGLLQALGVVVYIGLVSVVFWRGNEWFQGLNTYLGPLFVLTLFVSSALLTAAIVFYKPYLLFTSKKREEAAKLVLYTTKWLVSFVVGAILLLVLFR